MKCKYCQAEMEDGAAVCPLCGMEQELPAEESASVEQEAAAQENSPVEEAEAVEAAPAEPVAAEEVQPEIKEGVKATPGKIALAVAAGVVILAVLVALIISGLGAGAGGNQPTDAPTAAPTEAVETVPATIPPDGNPEDVTCKGTYTVTDDLALAGTDTVVATMGDKELTNGLLQVYYWEEVYAFLQQYSGYSYFGLDFTQPLDVQICTIAEGNITWQQYFLGCAIDTWRSYQAMALEAETNGFELDQETQDYLDGLAADMEQMALEDGYADAEDMIAQIVGVGPGVEDYVRYVELYHQGYMYFSDVYEKTEPTAEEVEAFFAENESTYAEYGITKDSGKYVDVRHILLTPEGGTVDENGVTTYSDEEWEACRVAAVNVRDQWEKGDATEESFAKLANEHSTDPGSNTNGGLYTQVYEGQMVQPFNDWCFDDIRQEGDHGLVKTDYGYHVMYFVGSQDIWYINAEYDLISEITSAMVSDAMEKYPAEVHYEAIELALVELA